MIGLYLITTKKVSPVIVRQAGGRAVSNWVVDLLVALVGAAEALAEVEALAEEAPVEVGRLQILSSQTGLCKILMFVK